MPKSVKKSSTGGVIASTPPKHLGRIGSAMWRKLAPVLNDDNNVARVDANLLELYCSQYEIYRTALKHIQVHGSVVELYKTSLSPTTGEVASRDFVGYKRNPSTLIYSDAVAKLAKLGAELGLSPKSRAELLALDEPAGEVKPADAKVPSDTTKKIGEFFNED